MILNKFIGFAFIFIIPMGSSARADDLDVACGSYRSDMNGQKEQCENITLSLDRSACIRESYIPKEKAYTACIRSFNESGARATMEKSARGKRQQPEP